MKKNILIFLFFSLSILFWFLYTKEWTKNQYLNNEVNNLKTKINFLTPKNVISSETKKSECNIETKEVQVEWISMEPFIKNGETTTVDYGYYHCNDIVRWDLVIYKSTLTTWPVIKKLIAIPWDVIFFENRNMILNWKILSNSIWEKYIFSDQEINRISWYTPNWTLQENAFLIFWDNINSNQSRDSRAFGPVSSEYFLWKVKK